MEDLPWIKKCFLPPFDPRTTRNGKQVSHRPAKTVLTILSSGFGETLLCDTAVLNLGDACPSAANSATCRPSCTKQDKPFIEELLKRPCSPSDFSKVTIRRQNAVNLLRGQLFDAKGRNIHPGVDKNRVVSISTLVDPSANMDILWKIVEACNLILTNQPAQQEQRSF